MKVLSITVYAGEVHKENNKHDYRFKNISQIYLIFGKEIVRGIAAFMCKIQKFYEQMCA